MLSTFACDCASPQVAQGHKECRLCGRKPPTAAHVAERAQWTVKNTGKLPWERTPVFANDHDVGCTCFDCVMRRG